MNRKEKSELFGQSTAIHMFVSFLNEKNRGPKFKWCNFSDMVGRHAAASLHTYVFEPAPTDKEKEIARTSAVDWANDALKESGILEKERWN